MSEKRTIFTALNKVQTALSQQGIAKNQKNTHGKYKFRGIDDVYNTLSVLLADAGVVIAPGCLSEAIERVTTSGGKPTNHAKVMMKYEIWDKAGDSITVTFPGEAMDTGDKAINKATTAAYKYMLFQLFCIPVEGNEDADSESHVVSNTIGDAEVQEFIRLMNMLEPHVQKSVEDWLAKKGVNNIVDLHVQQWPPVKKKIEDVVARCYAEEQQPPGEEDATS